MSFKNPSVLALLLILIAASSQAQYVSNGGLFEVDWIRGCPGAEIAITILNPTCDCSPGCSCNFAPEVSSTSVDEDDFSTFKFTHIYNSSPGEYYLVILMDTEQDYIPITIEELPPPNYSIYACSGEAVSVEIDDTTYESYEVDFDDGTIVTIPQGDPVPDHYYGSATPRTISVRGLITGSANNCDVTTTDFVPMSALPLPQITEVNPIDKNSLDLVFTTDPFIKYELATSVNGGPFNKIADIQGGDTGFSVNSLDLENDYYCFQLASMDPCGGPSNVSNTACSIQANLSQGDGIMNVFWQTNGNSAGFDILRDQNPLGNVDAATFSYGDTTGVCGTTYCYQVRSDFFGATSTSLPVCGEFIRTSPPPPIVNVSTTVQDKNVLVEWFPTDPADYGMYDVYRQGPDNQPMVIGQTSATSFLDEGLEIPGLTDYCYEIVPTDNCGNTNPENIDACVMQLAGEIDLRDEVSISWNAYEGYKAGVQYYSIERADENGTFVEVGQTNDTTFVYTDSNDLIQGLMLRITAYPKFTNIGPSISNVIILNKTIQLIYPEAFTPDDDGLNDNFEIRARYLATYEIQIFNRWGEMVFTTTDINNSWDGRYKGHDATSGVYAGNIHITDESGHEIKRQIGIVLVRH